MSVDSDVKLENYRLCCLEIFFLELLNLLDRLGNSGEGSFEIKLRRKN